MDIFGKDFDLHINTQTANYNGTVYITEEGDFSTTIPGSPLSGQETEEPQHYATFTGEVNIDQKDLPYMYYSLQETAFTSDSMLTGTFYQGFALLIFDETGTANILHKDDGAGLSISLTQITNPAPSGEEGFTDKVLHAVLDATAA